MTDPLDPPPERDLPPLTATRIRGELDRRLFERRSPRRRYAWLAVAATAVVALVVTLGVAWPRPAGHGGPATSPSPSPSFHVRRAFPDTTPSMPTWTPGVPAPTPTSKPGAPELPAGWQQPHPTVPGVSLDQERLIIAECWTAGPSAATNDPPQSLQLFNLFHDRYGEVAFLISPHDNYVCDRPTGSAVFGKASVGGDSLGTVWYAWLTGDIRTDAGGYLGSVVDPATFPNGYGTVAGRVTSRVARVVVSVGSRKVTASIQNGTFLARIPYPPNVPYSQQPTVTAYDAAGHEVPTDDRTCYRTPAGFVFGPAGATDCKPAVRWPS